MPDILVFSHSLISVSFSLRWGKSHSRSISVFKLWDLRRGTSPSPGRTCVFSSMGKVWGSARCSYQQLHRQGGLTSVCLSLWGSSSAYGFQLALHPRPPSHSSYLPDCLPCVPQTPAKTTDSAEPAYQLPQLHKVRAPPLSAPSLGVVQLLGSNPD